MFGERGARGEAWTSLDLSGEDLSKVEEAFSGVCFRGEPACREGGERRACLGEPWGDDFVKNMSMARSNSKKSKKG